MIGIGLIGFGRVGRSLFKEILCRDGLEIRAISEIAPLTREPSEVVANLAYLLAHDTTYGTCTQKISCNGPNILLQDHNIPVLLNSDCDQVDWEKLGVDILVDATGDAVSFKKVAKLAPQKVKKVLITRGVDGAQATLARGVNLNTYDHKKHHVVSCSTCTANALAPTLKVLDQAFGVKQASIASIHPALSGDSLLDATANEFSAGRSGLGVRPVTSSVAQTTAQLLPQLKGKLMAMTLRVPTLVVNALVVDALLDNPPENSQKVIEIFESCSQGELKDVICLDKGFCGHPKVAQDFNGLSYSAVLDLNWLALNNEVLRLLIWHDNEYAYCCRVADTLEVIAEKLS